MAELGKIAHNAALAMEIPMAPIGAGFLGYLVDQHFGTGLRWTLILAFFGLVHAAMTLVRLTREFRAKS